MKNESKRPMVTSGNVLVLTNFLEMDLRSFFPIFLFHTY